MMNFPIVDSHVHLIDRERLRYPWLASAPAIDRDATLADYDAARGAVEVEAMVFVEADVAPDDRLAEVAFVAELAARDPRIKGIVASAPLEIGAVAVAPHLEALSREPLVRGVRRLLQGEAPDFSLAPDFIDGVRSLADHGFSFDICVNFRQIGSIVRFAGKVPNVPFVLDHIGKPAIAAGTIEPWATAVRELGAMEHVSLKMSGVATEANRDAWRPDDLRPFIEAALSAFGYDRTMFGGDWPVSTLAIGYEEWVSTLDGILGEATTAEREMLYRTTAKRVYRLGH